MSVSLVYFLLFALLAAHVSTARPPALNTPICLDAKKREVRYIDRESYDRCVYSIALPSHLFAVREPKNPNCAHKGICFAGCAHSTCLSVRQLNEHLHIKKYWSHRFVWIGSLLLGFGLASVYAVHVSQRAEVQRAELKRSVRNDIDSDEYIIEEAEEDDSSDSGGNANERKLRSELTSTRKRGSRSLSYV